MRKSDYFVLIAVLFISIGLISYFIVSHIDSVRNLKEIANEEPDFEPTTLLDLNDPKVMEEVFRKIDFYKSIESNQIKHFSLSEIEEEEKNAKKLRTLEESNIFENVALIDHSKDSIYYTTRWVYKSIQQLFSNVILYPYAFNYSYEAQNEENETITKTKEFAQGAFISLNTLDLQQFQNIGLKTNGTFSAKKARAVFDADVAILSIEYTKEDHKEESLQDAIDWDNYFLSYFQKGVTCQDYAEFLELKTKNKFNSYVTRINETEVINGNLINDGMPRFGILVIPDYQLGTDVIIKSKLGDKGMKNIVDYYNKGGKIIVNGKSGTLLEDFNLMVKGVYDRTKLLSINNANRLVRVKGCESTYRKNYTVNDKDFEKQMICMCIPNNRQVTLATSFKSVKNDTNYSPLMYIDSNNQYLVTTNVNDGLTYNLTEEEKKYNPLILFRKNDKNGQIFVMNYNPCHDGGDRSIILNMISFALSKELYMTSKVNMNDRDIPIPAGEFGFILQINTLIHNLNDNEMTKSTLYLFLPENFGWTNTPTDCQRKKYNKNDIPNNVRQKKTFENNNDYLVCNLKTISKYQKKNFKVSISVLNSQATQSKYQVLILEPILTFIDSNNQENIFFDQIKANCEAAALIRGTINPDPSGIYPLPGRGYYMDNILRIENKEESPATEVEYYGLIPLISPMIGELDQSETQWSIKIYADYYNSNNFEVPLKSLNATDYIYPAELRGKGAIICLEWDSPVLPTKEIYTKKDIGLGEEVDTIPGINNALLTINSTTEVIKQVNYRVSDRFYKLASQRLMAFIDTTTPEGAQTIYKGNIPKDLVDPKYNDRTKIDFLFSRLDIFFYDNKNYYNPPEILENPEKYVFSVDKYREYKKNSFNCTNVRGKARSVIAEEGYFSNNGTDKRDTILKPHIYTNELFQYCDLTLIDPTDENENQIKKYFGDTENFKLVHYIIPNVAKNITKAGQLYNFTAIDDYHAYHNKYPSIKFIYVHSLKYIIKSNYCLYGGRIIINIGKLQLGSEDDVTVSPDQIAVFKTEYEKENHNIIIYFKRGLMSNEQFGKDVAMIINIENLNNQNKPANFTFTLEELKFDISDPSNNYEKYIKILSENMTFNYISVFRYPALQIKATLNRTLNGYEALEPFSRYGLYVQELGHRTLYGYGETHHETDPGAQGNGFGFSFISNLGISSIPFIEYMSVGKGQVIPAGTSSSRVSWKDIWGRQWQQPLRSLFPDIPPIPPPIKNFWMTTTYEIIRKNKQIYEWVSDEDVLIHLHIKLLSNYPKYFEITRCKENQIRYVPFNMFEDHHREYENKSKENLTESELNGNNMFLRQGGMASYGVCYSDERAYVSGKKVEGELLKQIEEAKLCADHTDENLIKQCAEKLENIQTISRSSKDWDEEKNGTWNYSPLVEDYYPKGYIEPDMWQMTHVDYYDTAMDKAYKYHSDNVIPNYDAFDHRFASPDIIKPQNSIAIPIYKGLGYNIVYDKNTGINYHGQNKKGWWSDNLQNKDDTLLAGQDICNNISVDKKSSIIWVDGKDLVGSKRKGSEEAAQKIVQNKQKNIYSCLFNRKRPQYNPSNPKSYHPRNVVENNIIPIVIDLDRDDKRLTEFDCNVEQYTPDNIYTYDGNYLKTPTSKDYLYFAANLRGHAKETINIVMNLKKFDKIKYEGNVKVNEGGRFVYWVPVNGPNSYIYVDDPVNIIKAKRNDIDIINNVFPLKVATFNSVLYHAYIFRDENKMNKEWPYTDYYTNSYGYGDVTVSVSVGGIKKTKPALQPGGTTYAKIIFYNNCGFDWNMKDNAIKFDYKGSKPISGNDLLWRYVHSIRLPTEYTFLNYEVEKSYSQYISIKPSDHNIDVAPELFDFENINVVTIRDGFKGEYNLKIDIDKNFPDELRGKPIQINVTLNKEYFDKFPGYKSDPIPSYHNYNVEIPPIYIAVPFNKGDFKDKVLYTSCQASNLNIQFDVGVDWKIDGIKYISRDFLDKMVNATQEINASVILNNYWNSIKNKENISYYESNANQDKKRITINGIQKEFEYFPKKVIGAPDISEAIIIVRSSISQLKQGNMRHITDIKINYNDWIDKPKLATALSPIIQVSGAWLELTYSRTLVDDLGNGNYADKQDQKLYPEDSGIMKVQFKLTNTGNGHSYNTKYEIILEPNLSFVGYNTGTNKIDVKKNNKGQTILSFDYGAPILSGELKGGIIYLNYSKICDSYDSLSPKEKEDLPKSLSITKESAAYLDLTNTTGENRVVQHLRQSLSFAYSIKNKTGVYIDLIVAGKRSNPSVTIKPKINCFEEDSENNIKISIAKVDASEYKENLRKLEDVLDNE